MNIGKPPWIHIGISNQGPVYVNRDTGDLAVEDLQSGRLIEPKRPVVIELVDPLTQSTTRKSQ